MLESQPARKLSEAQAANLRPAKNRRVPNATTPPPVVHLFLLLIGIAFSFAAVTKAQNFTLEQVMSSPFPSDLIVSKRGDKLAWAFDAEGKRNIWVAEAPAFAARQVTRSNTDDGQELSDLVFSPNGSAIAYVRGQGKIRLAKSPTQPAIRLALNSRFWSSIRERVA